MLLRELFKYLDYKVIKGNLDIFIKDICYDSKRIKDGNFILER